MTVKHNGKMVDVVAQTTKHGVVYVFNRETGESLFPVEIKKFPPSTIPGEVASPVQPMPTKPAPFARQLLTGKWSRLHLPVSSSRKTCSRIGPRKRTLGPRSSSKHSAA